MGQRAKINRQMGVEGVEGHGLVGFMDKMAQP
jgi:hypothetical protein